MLQILVFLSKVHVAIKVHMCEQGVVFSFFATAQVSRAVYSLRHRPNPFTHFVHSFLI